ncbi:hypothetical protein PV761_14030 [Arthrobacter sp. CC3]
MDVTSVSRRELRSRKGMVPALLLAAGGTYEQLYEAQFAAPVAEV